MLAAAAALGGAGLAHAALLEGQTVDYLYFFPDAATPYEFAPNGHYRVGEDVEIVDFVDFGGGSIDLADTRLTLTFTDLQLDPASFNGFRIGDVHALIPPFAAVTVDDASTVVFSPTRLRHDADHIWVNLESMSFTEGQRLVLHISAVPESGAWVLMAAGLLALAAAARRRR